MQSFCTEKPIAAFNVFLDRLDLRYTFPRIH